MTLIRELIETLRDHADRVFLRVVEAPGVRVVHEFTGAQLLDARDFARRQAIAENARVILLHLPHSPELFLLHIGLTLIGKTPAVLPWPTTRIDAFKYQRNLLQQLSQLANDAIKMGT